MWLLSARPAGVTRAVRVTAALYFRPLRQSNRLASTAGAPPERPDDEHAAREITAADLRQLMELAKPEVPALLGSLGAVTVGTVVSLAWPVILGRMLDVAIATPAIAGPDLFATPVGLACSLFGLSMVGAASTATHEVGLKLAGARISMRLRQHLYGAILARETAFFDRHRTGDLLGRLESDVGEAQAALTGALPVGFGAALHGVGATGMLLWLSPTLTAVSLAALPGTAAGAYFVGRHVERKQAAVQAALATSSSHAQETLRHVRTVRTCGMERHEQARYAEATERAFGVARSVTFTAAACHGGVAFCWNLGIAALIGCAGSEVARGAITPGDMSAFMLYSLALAGAAQSGSQAYTSAMRAAGASGRVFEIIGGGAGGQAASSEGGDGGESEAPSVAWSSAAEPLGERQERLVMGARSVGVEVDDLWFAYPTRPERPVFSGLSLSIRPGEHLALTGASGSGKSTLAALLTRLYDADMGSIAFNGIDARRLRPEVLRSLVAVVPQEPALMSGTVLDNIRYGSPGATDAQARAAAEEANAAEFISSLPRGYLTEVGDGGALLSGGQRQRIAIARALLRDPPLIILDEATSALDAQSEAAIQWALERLSARRTVLSIAHRVSTIRAADRIAFVQGGVVAESGTYEELLRRPSLESGFQALVWRQLQETVEERKAQTPNLINVREPGGGGGVRRSRGWRARPQREASWQRSSRVPAAEAAAAGAAARGRGRRSKVE